MSVVTASEFKNIKLLLAKAGRGDRGAKSRIAAMVDRSYELVRIISKFDTFKEYKEFQRNNVVKSLQEHEDDRELSAQVERQTARANKYSGHFITLLVVIFGVALFLFVIEIIHIMF